MVEKTQAFKDQGGIATMDPSVFRRWLISKVMTRLASEERMVAQRRKAEARRQKQGGAHLVEYFHQVDDGYSHLACQVLEDFVDRYDIELKIYLVTAPVGANAAEPELALQLGLKDAQAIAPFLNLSFPDTARIPEQKAVELAQRIIAAQTDASILLCLAKVSDALWRDDTSALQALADKFGSASTKLTEMKLVQGNDRREKLQHYAGAMFYYAGEWYWGVDRLYHLEERLHALGTDKQSEQTYLAAKPKIEVNKAEVNAELTLEIYASLRSPYTAIVFDRAVKLAKDAGINYVVRPVLPMVMRGVPATKEKGFYILFDTAREARAEGVPYGNVKDPIGQPARHGYALFQWAREQNKGIAFFSNFLSAAFALGVNTNRESGLKTVVENTGLDWQQARQHLTDKSWESELEDNRLTMYDSGLWGVPSFRLLDAQGNEVISAWGQDRLWLIAQYLHADSGTT